MTTSTLSQEPKLAYGELSDDELDTVSGGNKVVEFIVTYIATKVLDLALSGEKANPGGQWPMGAKIQAIQNKHKQ